MVLDNGEYWVPETFQLEFAADIFAGVPEIWLVVPEGNGKTTLVSGLALYHGDYTEDASVLMAASSRDQCGLLFGQAGGFVSRSPGFDQRFRVFEGYRRISCLRTQGRIQVFAADDRTGDGVIPTFALLDELHRHRTLRLYRTWRGKLDKRGGQLVAISTAGEPGSEFEITRERARTEAPDITTSRNGRHTRAASDLMVLHDFALMPEDDPEDLDAVADANPFTGVTARTLARKRASPTMTVGHWLRFVCNRATRTEAAAIGEAEWLAAEYQDEPPEPGERAPVVGLDVGWRWDTTAIAPLFERDWGWLIGRCRVLVPPRDGNSMRPEVIHEAFEQLHAEHPIGQVAMDRTGAEEIAAWLEDELGIEVIMVSQKTPSKVAWTERFLQGLRSGAHVLRHMHDPELTRHVFNAIEHVFPDGTSKFIKPHDSRTVSSEEQERREIDALDAAAMGYFVASAGDDRGDDPLFEILA